MSKFYVCSENHSIIGQMDTYLAFHRDRIDGNKTPGGGVREHHHSHHHHHHPKRDQARSPKPAAERVSEKPFSPTFPSLHDLTDDRHNGNYRHHSPENSPYPMGRDEPSDEALNKFRTANTVTITPELFEKMYLSPQNQVKGDLRQTFGNPTPLALLGFLLSLSPLSCELMGWRGAGVDGIATVGAYYFIGGFLMSLGGILEFFLGNTFSFVVFCSFGGFWFTLGATLTPAFNAYGAYSTDAAHPELGLTSPSFHASYGTLPTTCSQYPITLISSYYDKSCYPPRPQCSPLHIPLPLETTYTDIPTRFLPPIHGPHVIHIPDLRPTHKPNLRSHLRRSTIDLRRPDGLLLGPGSGEQAPGGQTASRGRSVRFLGRHGWLVDFLCADAEFGRFPTGVARG